jgi:hypothetical protein
MGQRGKMARFFRGLCGSPARLLLALLVWLMMMIGLWYGQEDWRGWRAWKQYRAAAEARGETFDLAAYIPKPVADEQNFAATPFIKSFFLHPNDSILTNDLYARANNNIGDTNAAHNLGRRHFVDLGAWQMASAALQNGKLKRAQRFRTVKTDLAARAQAAPAVLEGMKPDAAAFAELRAASNRKYARYPVRYDLENPWITSLPHLGKIKEVCLRLSLQACAELAAGQSVAALADVKLILSLADSLKSEPVLISMLVRTACVFMAVQPVWEGLAEHRWTDDQLQELQARFLSYDFLSDMDLPLKAEKADGLLTVDLVKKKGLRFLASIGATNDSPPPADELRSRLVDFIVPSGWFYREKMNYCALFEAQRADVVDLKAGTISPDIVASNSNEVFQVIHGGSSISTAKAVRGHCVIAWMLLPALSRVPAKIAVAQIISDQAALACALERYRLAKGQFPGQLESLQPLFMSRLPNDVITGRPYKYRRAQDGQFILYSVGWNEKDDHGAPGNTLFDLTQGDWVWQYPEQR